MEVLNRFWSKVVPMENGCLNFTSSIAPSGYGYFWYQGASRRAHRVIYQILIGAIAKGLELNHTCFNRTCVNVKHLETLTHKENMAYSRERADCCVNGHEYTEENTVINSVGYRECLVCQRKHSRESMRRHRAQVRIA